MTYQGYRRIQRIAHQMVSAAIVRKALPRYPEQQCEECGSDVGTMVWDHRNYSNALDVRGVCGSCNKILGPGAIDFVDVHTLLTIRVKFKRVIGGRPKS